MAFRPLVATAEATRRLELVFPKTAFDSVLSNPLAGAALVAMIYVDAVAPSDWADDPPFWARPSTCTWLSDAVLAHDTDEERLDWRKASAKSRRSVEELMREWRETFERRYADNSRETLRDETFGAWLEHGALRQRPGLPTSSSKGRWALATSFADLFDPSLVDAQLMSAIDAWREANMSPGARVRAMRATDREKQTHEVTVTLPGGGIRSLEPGHASLILKGVIEEWAPLRLKDAVVLTISEPGDKIYTGDAETLRRLGIQIDMSRVLPDAVLADVGVDPVTFWIIEAVATDGPITEERRKRLLAWADDQNIRAESCSFLSAFVSRTDAAARRRLKDLASGTFAWYADEPEHELAWYELS